MTTTPAKGLACFTSTPLGDTDASKNRINVDFSRILAQLFDAQYSYAAVDKYVVLFRSATTSRLTKRLTRRPAKRACVSLQWKLTIIDR